MVWNKTPQTLVNQIMETLRSDFSLRYSDIAQKLSVSEWLVSELARKNLTQDERVKRYSEINRHARLKHNPMMGKTRANHHNAKECVIIAGYLSEWAPTWWTGKMPKGNRVYTHQRVWCEYNGHTEVPSGQVIHHIDEDKFNNHPDNLICLSRRQHAQIHCVSNLLAKRNDYPKGVESSALEAQRFLLTGM
ncbi:MAG: HNH endonuclease [Pseudomonadota bacterium]|nr:HNH endonuclease [Pseudomonadota bacterium]